MYDAINKGIKMATGDVVDILNADDVWASDETLAHVASAFESSEVGSPKSEVDGRPKGRPFVFRGPGRPRPRGGGGGNYDILCAHDEGQLEWI